MAFPTSVIPCLELAGAWFLHTKHACNRHGSQHMAAWSSSHPRTKIVFPALFAATWRPRTHAGHDLPLGRRMPSPTPSHQMFLVGIATPEDATYYFMVPRSRAARRRIRLVELLEISEGGGTWGAMMRFCWPCPISCPLRCVVGEPRGGIPNRSLRPPAHIFPCLAWPGLPSIHAIPYLRTPLTMLRCLTQASL